MRIVAAPPAPLLVPRLVPLLAPLLVLGLLAGCGKKGAPSAPGPADEVKFPRAYPSR